MIINDLIQNEFNTRFNMIDLCYRFKHKSISETKTVILYNT